MSRRRITLRDLELHWASHGWFLGTPMVSKYDGTCAHCEQAILPGDNIVYVYQDKAVMCAACGMEVDAGER